MMNKKFAFMAIPALAAIMIVGTFAPASAGIGLELNLDIKPGSCPNPINLHSNGLVSYAILGSDAFDVTQIDITSLEISGVGIGEKFAIEDVATPYEGAFGDEFSCIEGGPDGIDDLVFKVPASLFSCLNSDGSVGGVTVTGTLLDGTNFSALDIIKIINKKECV